MGRAEQGVKEHESNRRAEDTDNAWRQHKME